ncbi:MAG TPA: serine hydrolase domain-containing protein [Acidimicrobiales bacterium]|nr:serine hydrolase domain-containing protein [Acidimicrobiales bacterium]
MPPASPLDALARWPVGTAAGAVVSAGGVVEAAGPTAWSCRVASITKPLFALACLVAVEEGSLELEAPAGPPGATVRHLLAHASGLPFEGSVPVAAPGRRRIYSNTGFDVLGDELARRTGLTPQRYLAEAVAEPLGLRSTALRGSVAKDAWSTVDDLAVVAVELLSPTLVAPATLDEAVTEQFPGLAGVVPGLGRYEPNPWGLGFEIKGTKAPHWTAPSGSPRTFGHFGASGGFLWVDPDAGVACAVLTDREFGDWAPPRWAALSEDVLARHRT